MPQSDEQRSRPDPDHEAICRKCGKCCRRKVLIGGRVVYMEDYCKHLDTGTMLCKVYERRFEVNPACKTIPAAIKMSILPADCPYVQDIPDYVPPIEDWNSPEAESVIDRFTHEYLSSADLTGPED